MRREAALWYALAALQIISIEKAMREHGVALDPGAQIEEFEVVRELGAGGFGITYLATDLQLHRAVAVKEYLPRDWGTRRHDGTVGPRSSLYAEQYQWGLGRFVEEARKLARLSHPRIVRVHRVFGMGGTAYMVMEYVEGRSLEEELKTAGRLGEARVREILEGLADGLAEVHGAGLLHRDIKPGNVMLRARGGTPVLIDFGAARQYVGRASRPLTEVLTPGYAPFEQYRSKGHQGPWTDIYALGALAYTCLSGRVPDHAPDRVLEDLLPSIGKETQGLSRELVAAVDAVLAVDARDRPGDIAAWRLLLGVHRPPPPPPPSPPPPSPSPPPDDESEDDPSAGSSRKWIRQRLAVVLAAVGLSLIPVAYYVNPRSGDVNARSADVNAQDGIGDMSLHSAAFSTADRIRALIAVGAEVNAPDNYGNTPLHPAAGSTSAPEVIRALISEGADMNARDYFGVTPLEGSAETGSVTPK